MAKTLLVGWDAACWAYLEPLLAEGRLPVLAGLMARGPRGVLESTMPPWTPTAWSTIVTGRDPGGHAIFDMLRRTEEGELQPINATFRRGAPFWRYLNRAGLKTGLVNVPFSYPPEPVDGFMVCGFGTPGSVSRLSYPDELTDRILAQYPDFKPEVDPVVLRTAPPDEIFRVEEAQQARFVEIAADLSRDYPVDVLVINLMFPDHANHKMPDMDRVHASYERTDVHLGRLIETFVPDNIMLISDHGSSRLSGDFWLGAWLRDQGFVIEQENGPEAQAAALNWLLLEQARTAGHDSGFAQRVIRRLKRLGLQSAPAGVRERLWARFEADLPDAQAFIRWSGEVDLERSALIPGSAYAGLLYVNPAYSGDRAALLAELRSGLMKVIDPDTGRRLFTAVHDGRSLYDAPEVAPDVVVDAYDSTWNIRTGKYTSHPGPAEDGYFYREAAHRDFGWHSRDGVYVFAGPAFSGEQRGARAGLADVTKRAGLADIAATLLHLHGVPLPEDFDGAVMRAALSEALRSRPAERQAPIEDSGDLAGEAYSAEEAEALTDHLRSLGYLD